MPSCETNVVIKLFVFNIWHYLKTGKPLKGVRKILKSWITMIDICLRRILPQQKILRENMRVVGVFKCSPEVVNVRLRKKCQNNRCMHLHTECNTYHSAPWDRRDVNQNNVFKSFLLFNLSFSTFVLLLTCSTLAFHTAFTVKFWFTLSTFTLLRKR